MTTEPREVRVIQSPCRHTPGIGVEVAVVVAAAVGVVPEVDRHRRHRVGDDQFADLVDDRPAARRPRPAGRCPGTAAWSSPMYTGRVGTRPGEAGAHVGAAADRGDPQVLARPRRAASGSRRAAAASRWSPRSCTADRSKSRPGCTLGLAAGHDVRGRGAEDGGAGAFGDPPLGAGVGVAGAAVVEHDRWRPSAGRRRGSSTSSSRWRCTRRSGRRGPGRSAGRVCLRCSSRMPPWDWTMALGRPVVPEE